MSRFRTSRKVVVEHPMGEEFHCDRPETVFGPLIPVNPSKRYEVKGLFKSVGEVESRMYFGIACYDDQERMISNAQVRRDDRTAMTFLRLIEDSRIRLELVPDLHAMERWKDASQDDGYRNFAVYPFGNLGSFVESEQLGVYQEYVTERSCGGPGVPRCFLVLPEGATLSAEIRARLIPYSSKLVNHFNHGGYCYCGASNVTLPREGWHCAEGVLQGEEWGDGPGYSAFRKGTRFVRLVILANYQQSEVPARMTCKDVVLREILGEQS